MKDIDVKGKYEGLRKKFPKLPKFEDLNKDFELDYLEKDNLIHKTVRRRLNDKLIFFCRILEGILYPNPQSQINAYESGFFDEDEKKELAAFYRKLMILERRSLLLDVTCKVEDDVNHIMEVYSKWPGFKKEMTKVVDKMQGIWKSEDKKDAEGAYFG